MLRRKIVRSLLAVLAAIGIYALYIVATNNFHTVIAGELYRSARPSPSQIDAYHARYGIKTIINLMGAHPEDAWYRDEKAAAEANGITLIDHKMSAQRDVSAEEVEELLAILSNAERPILVHCRSGADRSGIVSALYVAGIAFGVLRRVPVDPLLRAPSDRVHRLLCDGSLVRGRRTASRLSRFLK